MIEQLKHIKDFYDDLLENHSDPRTRDWPLVKSPIPMLCLVAAYIVFVKIVGPRMMANRKPFQLKRAMIVYNALQAFICLYLFIQASIHGWLSRYSFVCQPIVVDHPDEPYMLTLGWYFYLVRFLEFTDTVFFILRKKFSQVSTLHVVHHSLVPMLFWAAEKFVPAGQYTLAAYLNGFVHFFMYSYYLLAAMGPRYSRFVWWKKYMTKLQLTQFILVLVHTLYTLASSCNVPKPFGYLVLFQAILFFFMFFGFYNEAFTKKAPASNGSTNLTSNGKSHDPLSNKHTNGTLEESLKNGHPRKQQRIHSD